MGNPLVNSAVRFRIILLIALTASILAVVGVVIYGVGALNSYADEVKQQVIAAETSETSLENIRTQVNQLEQNQAAVERAKKIVADSQQYKYQDTIIRDIESFASRAGVGVLSYDFTAATDASAPSTPAQSPAPSAPSQPGGGSLNPGSQLAAPTSNLRSTVVNISIASPVNYRNFLNFLHYIEQNLTKMQVASVSLSGAGSSTEVSTGPLQIEVYVR